MFGTDPTFSAGIDVGSTIEHEGDEDTDISFIAD